MTTIPLHCCCCDHLLEAPADVLFLRCARCQAQLAVRQNDSARYTVRAADDQLAALQEQVRELAAKVEVMQIDSAWEHDRHRYGAQPATEEGYAFSCLVVAVLTVIGMGLGTYFIYQGGTDGFAWVLGAAFIVGTPALCALFARQGMRYQEARARYLRQRSEAASIPSARPAPPASGAQPSTAIQSPP